MRTWVCQPHAHAVTSHLTAVTGDIHSQDADGYHGAQEDAVELGEHVLLESCGCTSRHMVVS